MSVQPNFQRGNQSAAVLRIIELLHDAAALVFEDPNGTQIRMSEASNLLNMLQAPPRSGGIIHVLAPWQARRIHSYIEAHLDQTIRVESLAGQVQLSVSHFFRAFRGTFGITPLAFIMHCRTNRAKEMLGCTNDPISQIASACGFADQAHFSRIFARNIGMPPGVWRRLQRGDAGVMSKETEPANLFPLNRSRRLGRHVIDDAVDAFDLVDDPCSGGRQEAVVKGIAFSRHAIK
jgi:AraC-like DNA-binding protein